MDQWADNEEGGGGGGGGGYFGGNDLGTPTQSVATPSSRQQFLCPVTVRQVLEASEQGLKVGSLTATMVSLCGVVSNIESTSTTIKFCLSDDTGIIDCLEWLESQESSKAQNNGCLLENNYYHVYGCIKFPQGKRRIMVFKIIKVKDFNEITAFMAEVLSASEYAGRIQTESKHSTAFFHGQNSSHPLNNALVHERDKLTPIQKTILDAISAVQNPVGWSKHDCGLIKKYSDKEIQDTLEKLVSEGHIYTTIDDDHFCCT